MSEDHDDLVLSHCQRIGYASTVAALGELYWRKSATRVGDGRISIHHHMNQAVAETKADKLCTPQGDEGHGGF